MQNWQTKFERDLQIGDLRFDGGRGNDSMREVNAGTVLGMDLDTKSLEESKIGRALSVVEGSVTATDSATRHRKKLGQCAHSAACDSYEMSAAFVHDLRLHDRRVTQM
jgi:hypothetical protein